ncbi:MAG: hypothetical protein WD844_10095 [Thermoleophilaceae bacterium]
MSEPRQTTRPDDPFAGAQSDWDAPPPPPPRPGAMDLSALFVLVDALRGALPSGVQGQFTSLLRELLLTLRSLIDWYLERLDRGPKEPEVEEIRID